jgi:hypothetical protein
MQAFVLRLKAGDEERVGLRTFSFHCRDCDPSTVEATFRRGIVRIHDFVGKDEQGRTIHAVLRIRLDSSSGPELQ